MNNVDVVLTILLFVKSSYSLIFVTYITLTRVAKFCILNLINMNSSPKGE